MTATASTTTTIRERREQLGLTREQLARESDVGLAWLATLERGLLPKRSRALERVHGALARLEGERTAA